MKLRLKVYGILVNRVPEIQKAYHNLRRTRPTRSGRMYAWLALLLMNAMWIFGIRRFGPDNQSTDGLKRIPSDQSESSLSYREPPEELAERLMEYDVISFDVFDTLIFRPFSKPADLFFIIGEKLQYLDFERIRIEMEGKAREKKKKEEDHYEVTLEDIYDCMEVYAGIPKEKGMLTEIETESELCFANPYMRKVLQCLKGKGKKIIATTDMYLPKTVIKHIVENCGFEGIEEYYVSCEHQKSKSSGNMYPHIKKIYSGYYSFIHIGDNPHSDIMKAQKNDWHAEYYKNVNLAGAEYRAEDMSVITGSFYRGIVNAHIHNGSREYSMEYELGFIYGGLFVLGYCQFIHAYVKAHDIDKILFLSRDGDIINQVYSTIYPEECNAGKTEYVYWSRLAATKMSAARFKYDYFKRFLYHKVNQKYTLQQIFTSMEIEDLLQDMVKKAEKEAIKIQVSSELSNYNVEYVKKFLIDNWELVVSHYEEQTEAGGRYYQDILHNCRKVCAVDVGWAGSGAAALNYLVNDVWKIECEVIGLLAGTNTVHNVEANISEPLLHSGQLVSYLFSQEFNRELWKMHDAGKGHNLLIEILLGSCTPSFKGFKKAGESYELEFCSKSNEKYENCRDVQTGIIEFAAMYTALLGKWKNASNIAGRDFYACMNVIVNSQKYTKALLDRFAYNVNIE